jgi:hypothetical protein
LTVTLPAPGSTQEPSFSLVDEQGRLRLFRTLTRPGSTRARDCVALADTVVLIVQRYLEEVELPEVEAAAAAKRPAAPEPAPNPPDPPSKPVVALPRPVGGPRWDFSLGPTARVASQTSGWGAADLRLTIAHTMGRRLDTGFLAAGWLGISGPTSHRWNGGQGQVVRVPLGLAFMWRRALSTVELQLGLAGLVDAWVLSAMYQDKGSFNTGFSFSGGAVAGLQVPLGKSLFVRMFADLAVAALRPWYFDPADNQTPAFSTPLVFGDAGFALGMSLR